jgi:hypothetical protein
LIKCCVGYTYNTYKSTTAAGLCASESVPLRVTAAGSGVSKLSPPNVDHEGRAIAQAVSHGFPHVPAATENCWRRRFIRDHNISKESR